ncbi:MAG: hypothetical protein H6828_08175 [Planctomycetes bacterium]|nr:hypothetical protein [Planctomycetota bacterium]
MTVAAPRRPATWLLALPALVAYALLAWKLAFLCDDAFISFRYSKHLAAGEGLRYNLTLGAPVEGYSNFLWVVWLALFEKLGLDVPLAARWSSALCGAGLVVWVTAAARRRLDLDALGTALTGLFLATLPPFALWATGGLATMPTALFVFGVWERLFGDPERPRGWQAGAFAALAGLVRADGAVWALMLLGAGGLVWALGGRKRELCRALTQATLVLFAVVGAHVVWRHGYYGDWLPNTARVKAGFSTYRLVRGLQYLGAYVLTVPTVLVALASAARRWPAVQLGLWLPAVGVVLGTWAYGIWVGGDFMPMGRFLFPSVPFLALLVAAAWARFARGGGRVPLTGIALALCAVGALGCFDHNVVPASMRERFRFRQDRDEWQSEIEMHDAMYQRARQWTVQGRALGRVTQPGETYVAGAIGAIGYYSELELFDLYGLVTPSVIAGAEPLAKSSPGHDVRVPETFFEDRHPTYLGSVLVPAGAPPDYGLPGGWNHNPLSKRVTLEPYPVLPEDGLADLPGEHIELRLLRYHRWE